MNAAEFFSHSRRTYSSLLREVEINGLFYASKQLPFFMEEQTQSNWCWAATATSVSHFYWMQSYWTQCLVANAQLNQTNCCTSPAPCNVPSTLNSPISPRTFTT